MTATLNPAELVEHADRLHQALYALATSEDRYLSTEHNADDANTWGPYDHTEEALIQVLTRIVGTRYRAEQIRLLMLDDSGEGAAYWLEQEAQGHQWELDMAHEEAVEMDAERDEAALLGL